MKQFFKALFFSLLLASMPLVTFAGSSPFQGEEAGGGFGKYFEQAIGDQTVGSDLANVNADLAESLPRAIGRLINTFLGFVGIILLIIFIMAGFMWLTAGGNTQKVEDAKKYMRNATIGMILAFSAFAFTSLVVVLLERVLAQTSS